MIASIPMPPVEGLPGWQLATAGLVGLVCGAAVLLWGRTLHRGLLALAAGACGFFCFGWAIQSLGLPPMLSRLALTLVLAGLVLVGARFVWAGAAGLAVWAAVLYLVLPHVVAPAQWPAGMPAVSALPAWPQMVAQSGLDTLATIWRADSAKVILIAGSAGLAVLVLLAIRPRLGAILMTSAVGAVAVVAGTVLLVTSMWASMASAAWRMWHVSAGMIGLLTAFGIFVQYRSALASAGGEGGEPAADEESAEPKKKASKGKK